MSELDRSRVEDLLSSAVDFAKAAGNVTLRYFGGLVDAEDKSDGSPVTRADREAESLLRRRIGERYPNHGVLGEEFGEDDPDADIRWVLDPIDGTRSFMRGVPLYGVLIGIEAFGEPVVGVAHFPALDETVAAGRGLGCTWNGDRCQVSEVEAVANSLVLTTDVERVLRQDFSEGWRALAGAAAFSRSWGDCYGHILVATGRAEIMVDPILSAWDAGPLLTILTEAGGEFTDLSGKRTIHGGSGISTNGRLHDEALEVLLEH